MEERERNMCAAVTVQALNTRTNIQHVLALFFRDEVSGWAARRGVSSRNSE